MTTQEAIDYCGGRKELAQALNIWPHAIGRWGKHPPELRQYQLERISKGKLQAEKVKNNDGQ